MDAKITDREYKALLHSMNGIKNEMKNGFKNLGDKIENIDRRVFKIEIYFGVMKWLSYGGGVLVIIRLIMSIFDFISKLN